ncbi:hypothetical protein J0A68_08800 [Algoriphagus sp. H41]|uniref:DUF6973 domain-containing protein n=1 Tax=Algoriphagus oliviformis TaxID=2811231 RepID=A0ABS3C289_9BACT|nr:hypothetical protein [Algoriphagus oliviformis]MBN7811052.1 hypothetical protein [Algoriphagus oliviformis]
MGSKYFLGSDKFLIICLTNQTKPNQTKPNFALGRIFVAVILGLLVASCIEEESDQISDSLNPEIQSAKVWYEQVETLGEGSENARKFKNGKGKPNWANSKVYRQSDGKKVIEVQFDYEEIAIPEYLETEELDEKSVLQTLILFPKPDGSYVPYFLNVYPDDPEQKFERRDFVEGGYQKIPGEFNGVYWFYRWNGEFISGWRIKDGVKTHRIKEAKEGELSGKSSRMSSYSVYCYQLVTTWYQYTCMEGFGCTQPVQVGETAVYQCELVLAPPSTDPGSNGGGGGGTPPNTDGECEEPEGNLEGVTVDCYEEHELDSEEVIDYIENDLYKMLNPCEKELIRSDPKYAADAIVIYLNMIEAESKTIETFGINGWNDCSDAFRHAYWNALMTRSNGVASAALFGTAHECVVSNPNLENQMDLHNNNIGRTIASNNPSLSNSDIVGQILNSITNGELRIISNLAPSGRITLNSTLVSSLSCQIPN